MIGNDIVDLKLVAKESNWRRKGYLQKIFSPDEIKIIQLDENPDPLVWRLWSMKESAYKIIVRNSNGPFFSPAALRCTLIDEGRGSVSYKGLNYFVHTDISEEYVYSYTVEGPLPILENRIFALKPNPIKLVSKECKENVLLAAQTLYNVFDFELRKNECGIPQLYSKIKKLSIPLSISHHGMFGAFTFLKAAV